MNRPAESHCVFICYAEGDEVAAETVCAGLEAREITCRVRPRDLPEQGPADRAVFEAATRCGAVVLLVSAAASRSRSVPRELEWAVLGGAEICPIRLEPTPPAGSLALLTGNLQWLDAVVPPIERHLGEIARAVGAALQAARDRGDAAPEFEDVAGGAAPSAPDDPTIDRRRLEQRDRIAARRRQLRADEAELDRLRPLAASHLAARNLTAATEAVEALTRIAPWDPTAAVLRAGLDREPRRPSWSAVASPFVSILSFCGGLPLGMLEYVDPAHFPERPLNLVAFLVWLTFALLGAALGVRALRVIRHRPRDYFGRTAAWVGTVAGLGMAGVCVWIWAANGLGPHPHGSSAASTQAAAPVPPQPPNEHFILAARLKEQGQIDPALEEYDRAIREEPGNPEALYNRGCIYAFDKRDDARAVADFERVIRIDPRYSPVWWGRGKVRLRQNRPAEGQEKRSTKRDGRGSI